MVLMKLCHCNWRSAAVMGWLSTDVAVVMEGAGAVSPGSALEGEAEVRRIEGLRLPIRNEWWLPA